MSKIIFTSLHRRLNGRNVSLKYLAIFEVIDMCMNHLHLSNCETEMLINSLPIPGLIKECILEEFYLQVMLYFEDCIEPTIQITYPNEY